MPEGTNANASTCSGITLHDGAVRSVGDKKVWRQSCATERNCERSRLHTLDAMALNSIHVFLSQPTSQTSLTICYRKATLVNSLTFALVRILHPFERHCHHLFVQRELELIVVDFHDIEGIGVLELWNVESGDVFTHCVRSVIGLSGIPKKLISRYIPEEQNRGKVLIIGELADAIAIATSTYEDACSVLANEIILHISLEQEGSHRIAVHRNLLRVYTIVGCMIIDPLESPFLIFMLPIHAKDDESVDSEFRATRGRKFFSTPNSMEDHHCTSSTDVRRHPVNIHFVRITHVTPLDVYVGYDLVFWCNCARGAPPAFFKVWLDASIRPCVSLTHVEAAFMASVTVWGEM